jgi:hypothetical protein
MQPYLATRLGTTEILLAYRKKSALYSRSPYGHICLVSSLSTRKSNLEIDETSRFTFVTAAISFNLEAVTDMQLDRILAYLHAFTHPSLEALSTPFIG